MWRDALSRRRLATLGSLVLLTAFSYAMIAVRVAKTGNDPTYLNLVWNLFLAWIPFALALLVYDGYRRGASAFPLAVGAALWLVFFPNAPYIVTDFELLRNPSSVPIWYDVVLVSVAAWTGLLLGFISLYLVHSVARRIVGTLNSWVLVVAVLALGSYGIYLGRFERWNSWDLVARPEYLLPRIWEHVSAPLSQGHSVAVTAVFTAFLTLSYFVFYNFARLGGLDRPERHSSS